MHASPLFLSYIPTKNTTHEITPLSFVFFSHISHLHPLFPATMSTDLEFHQASLPPIKIETPLGSNIESDNAETSPCRTPTSAEHKIPVTLTCPPPPRKPKRVVRCKRRLREVDFFEIVNRKEVEEFFRSSLELGEAKKRCKCK